MKLHLEKINYKNSDLDPVMSKETLSYHRDSLAKSYVKRFNEGKGDPDFNEAGAFLHNLFFPQFKAPLSSNKPFGKSLELIKEKHGSFSEFKDNFQKIAMSIQGSGWVFMDSKGDIKTIKNHQKKPGIIILVDWWEHAWALDYQSNKKKYLDNLWKIIDWSVINDRLNLVLKSGRKKDLFSFFKKSNYEPPTELPKTFPLAFRRWLREDCYSKRIDQSFNIQSRCRLSNYFFNQESYNGKLEMYKRWKKREYEKELKNSNKETEKLSEPVDMSTSESQQLNLFE